MFGPDPLKYHLNFLTLLLGCVKKPKMLKITNVPPSCETID